MLKKYPNGEQFYINNKRQFEEIWFKAQEQILNKLVNNCKKKPFTIYDVWTWCENETKKLRKKLSFN